MYTCIFMYFLNSYNSTIINLNKFRSSIEAYPKDVNPIEVYPIEAYLKGKGAVEVSGCSRFRFDIYVGLWGVVAG